MTAPFIPEGQEGIPAPAPSNSTPSFTAEDLERVRKEEKDKLYARIESEKAERVKKDKALEEMQTEIQRLREAEEERTRIAAEKKAEADEARRQKQFEDADAKDLIQQVNKEWEQKFTALQQEQAQREAILEKEREFATLQAFIQRRVSEEQNNIAPELIDLINGNSPEEVEASIATLKTKTQAIVESVSAAQQAARAQMAGVSLTGYAPVGPMDTDPAQTSLSNVDIRQMPMDQYAQLRQKLGLGGSSQRNQGLFG